MIEFRFFFIFSFLLLPVSAFSQNTYPKITGYAGIVHPIVTFSEYETATNFKDYYVVGMPVGINIWKSPKVGFSMEFVPHIKAENGTSRMNNFLFHPGVLIALGKGYTFAGRAAFETSGRYGITPVLNKTVIKNKNSSYYIAIPLPVRLGNDKPTSFTIGFQFGIAF
ncbi:hypothetical protein SAMN04515674_105270 [Pseudarcicella hirudinis]|uniref:Outer membrane protein beta-barrel domain-containing protein n=1 Tax=Pseudarcicella hirudinis TaxID=1079859 RepID=A0A1I5SY51_9BACT|nr:hypothetical protein [Pseudarcicella hirudinis]SFP75638.1 hypothetical protein SAMN04515674_105270 [Pseudarcicella hirudinis]